MLAVGLKKAIRYFSLSPENLIKLLIFVPMCLIAFVTIIVPGIFVENVPLGMGCPDTFIVYETTAEKVNKKTDLDICWREMIALDAIQYAQDFDLVCQDTVSQTIQYFYWDEEETYTATVTDEEGNEKEVKRTRTVYYQRNFDEALAQAGINCPEEQEQAHLFLENTSPYLAMQDGFELPEGWEPGKGEYIWPVPGIVQISSPFGMRTHPVYGDIRFHNGIDIPAPTGVPIVASKEGVVSRTSYDSGAGRHIFINHQDGTETRYLHLNTISVREGRTVEQGDVIGRVGSTGISTGPHLHFEIRKNGTPVNPLDYFKERQ